jgi:beta-1,4-N-acetylglucosaminyltransferase
MIELALFLVLLVARLSFVMDQIRRIRASTAKAGVVVPTAEIKTVVRTLIVLGSGGHTTEMLELTRNLNPTHYSLTYCQASTDTTSVMRLPPSPLPPVVYNIPRSREVGQSYWTSLYSTAVALIHAVLLVARLRPHLIITNGPGTAWPIAVAALVGRVLGWCDTKTVFVESYCRVVSLSLTGKLLYYVVDVFCVHWPELHQRCPHSVLLHTFVAAASHGPT